MKIFCGVRVPVALIKEFSELRCFALQSVYVQKKSFLVIFLVDINVPVMRYV